MEDVVQYLGVRLAAHEAVNIKFLLHHRFLFYRPHTMLQRSIVRILSLIFPCPPVPPGVVAILRECRLPSPHYQQQQQQETSWLPHRGASATCYCVIGLVVTHTLQLKPLGVCCNLPITISVTFCDKVIGAHYMSYFPVLTAQE